MPELPEVNTFQKYFDGTSLHQRIMSTAVHDDKIFRNCTGSEFASQTVGATFIGSTRRGKYLFAHLDDGHHVLLHFGMTGDLKYYQDPSERPKHERFHFYFEGGHYLGFDCPRKFARIDYIEDLQQYIETVGIGTDALEITKHDFLQLTIDRKTTIKGFLLNQKLFAGVGNLYADEICYQARVHPASRVSALSRRKLGQIHALMHDILGTAIERSAYYKDYPEDWFWTWRDVEKPHNKGIVKSEKIAGRTTYYVSGFQKLYQ